jgi:hypothetical protein
LPISVDDSALLLSNVFPVPFPSFGVDGFSNGTDCSESRKVVTLGVLVSETTEETDSGRGGVELRNDSQF